MKVKVYKRKDGSVGRVEVCLNKGCGNSVTMPDLTVNEIDGTIEEEMDNNLNSYEHEEHCGDAL